MSVKIEIRNYEISIIFILLVHSVGDVTSLLNSSAAGKHSLQTIYHKFQLLSCYAILP